MEYTEPQLTDNALKVLERRYLSKDETGKVIETPLQMFLRVANYIASADKAYGKSEQDIQNLTKTFYDVMNNCEFVPNSPTLMNAGKDLGQLSACFVLPVEDSVDSIFEAIKATALIHKTGGGTGFDFSKLRPKNSSVKTTGGISSGPVSFMKVFNSATQAIKQGGTRRGANMGILRVDHPDILEFITCKQDDKEITNFNISVTLTEDFMRCVENGEEYNLIDPRTGKPVKKLPAREVFDLIVKMAWKNGEPGIIFIDKMNDFNPTPNLGRYEATNPCGEQVLLPYESCNLGSINLDKMVDFSEGRPAINWERLKTVTHVAVHFLDNVIDSNKFPLSQIEQKTKLTRKIGLGVMGWADMLVRLGVSYNSEEAIELASQVMSFILKEAEDKSHSLAEERGAFPAFSGSIYDVEGGKKIRNATLTTVAPTGTISIIAGASSGIEPLFALAYTRHVMDNDKLLEINPYFEKVAKERGFYSRELMEKIAEKGSCHTLVEVPEDVRRVFITSHDITPEWHIRMQAEFQKYTHNAVSKTVNFPHHSTVDDVKKVYILAHQLGCKGITIYRDKSREEQVLNISTKKEEKKEEETSSVLLSPLPRPEVTCGTTTKISTGCGNLYITVNEDDKGLPFEVFMQMGKSGGCAGSQLEAIGRLVSLALRSGLDSKLIIEQLKGIRCPSPSWEQGGTRIFSCADAIARALERRRALPKTKSADTKVKQMPLHRDEKWETSSLHHRMGNVVGVCPDCGASLKHEEGCVKCESCGYSKC